MLAPNANRMITGATCQGISADRHQGPRLGEVPPHQEFLPNIEPTRVIDTEHMYSCASRRSCPFAKMIRPQIAARVEHHHNFIRN